MSALKIIASNADEVFVRIPVDLVTQLEWACVAAEELRQGITPTRPERLQSCDELGTLVKFLNDAWWDTYLERLSVDDEERADFQTRLLEAAEHHPEDRDTVNRLVALLPALAEEGRRKQHGKAATHER
jgi:hypothetical protein